MVGSTSLVVIPSVPQSTARMQKKVIPSSTQGKHSETDGHAGVVVVVLHCGQPAALNCPFVAAYQLPML